MDIFVLLKEAKLREASDLHLVVSSPPLLRVNGSLEPVNGFAPLSSTEISQAFLQITGCHAPFHQEGRASDYSGLHAPPTLPGVFLHPFGQANLARELLSTKSKPLHPARHLQVWR